MSTQVKIAALPGEVLSEPEAAAYLHQKPRTIRLWRTRRGLPHLKVTGKVILYRKSELDNWLDRHRVQMRAA